MPGWKKVALLGTLVSSLYEPCMASDAPSSGKAISTPASGIWEGNDGSWSTFDIQIGTYPQIVRLLPATSSDIAGCVWPILADGCDYTNSTQPSCSESRGGLLDANSSLTWNSYPLTEEGLLSSTTVNFSTANVVYGTDTVTLGSSGDNLPTLHYQLIGGLTATTATWLGMFGLSPHPVTTGPSPNYSILQKLRGDTNGTLQVVGNLTNRIPSLSWAYTAGAKYMDPPVLGSLTYGGYDAERVDFNQSVSIPFDGVDLRAGLRSITFENAFGGTSLMSSGKYVYIDSLTPHMWLPIDVCQGFESAFGLIWDETSEMYLLNKNQSQYLKETNPTFKFTFGDLESPGNTSVVSVPYAAFNLNLTADDNAPKSYFPLKRAQNSTQYTLGRAFLQEAYVIADYDRKNLTVAQARFPSSSQQSIVDVFAPETEAQQHSRKPLSTGVIVGIVIGGVAVVTLFLLVATWLRWRRRLAQAKDSRFSQSYQDTKELSGDCMVAEMSSSEASRTELPAKHLRSETPDDTTQRMYELASPEPSAAELDAHRKFSFES